MTAHSSARAKASSRSCVTCSTVSSRSATDPAEHVLQLLARLRVDGAERLVEQQGPRAGGERPRQRDALALAAGQRRRAAGEQVRHADRLGEPPDLGVAARAAVRSGGLAVAARGAHPVGDVGGDREVREQQAVLEHEPDPAPLRRRGR